jgi:alkylresorcinol/alkylpyrone synthase
VDAHVANALSLGPRLARLPITESGCAGGVVGLARAADYLAAHPDRAVLLLALEFSSLTFQRWDRSPTNVVSTAIFGDGAAAAVLVGGRHPRAGAALVRVRDAESVFFPGTTHLMGFELRNEGLQILLDKRLTPFVRRVIVPAVDGFLSRRGLARADIRHFVLHPGGRRVVEAMSERLGLGPADLAPTEAVLSEHGNMSSVTVLFVLDEILRRHRPETGALGLLGAFGPGFAAELALLEFR